MRALPERLQPGERIARSAPLIVASAVPDSEVDVVVVDGAAGGGVGVDSDIAASVAWLRIPAVVAGDVVLHDRVRGAAADVAFQIDPGVLVAIVGIQNVVGGVGNDHLTGDT